MKQKVRREREAFVKKSPIYHDIEEHVSHFKKGPNNGRSPKKLVNNFRLDPMPFKWTLYRDGNIITYGYCHSRLQAEEMILNELSARAGT